MRQSSQNRSTAETRVVVDLGLDGYHSPQLETGVPFLEHMLAQIAMHGSMSLNIKAEGDLHIDAHHLVEDVGIVFGMALREAMGDKKSVERYGYAYVPLDEALSRVVIDLSGRPGLFLNATFTAARVGDFDVQLVKEFFQGLVNHAAITVHIDVLSGANVHHQIESLFKAFGRALFAATKLRCGEEYVPSTKQTL